jgi:hypothetical protein
LAFIGQVNQRQSVFSGVPGSEISNHVVLANDLQAEIEHINCINMQEN